MSLTYNVLHLREKGDLLDYSGRTSRWRAPPAGSQQWHVVVTELGADGAVVRRIEDLDLHPYRPITYKTVAAGRGRRREIKVSMFPCYLLLQMPGDVEAWRQVRAVRGVHDFLCLSGSQKLATLRDETIEIVRAEERRIGNKRAMRLAKEGKGEWLPGQDVWAEIMPFKTIMAKIVKADNAGKIELLLEMDVLGQRGWKVEPQQLRHLDPM